MTGYTPIFDSVFTGSLCGQYPDTAAWLFLLTLADRNGVVDMTPEYIAGVTGMPIEHLKDCIARFLEPDPDSRTAENQGRRLELVDPSREWGWHIINHAKYRERARLEARSASGADAARKRAERSRKAGVTECPRMSPMSPMSPNVPECPRPDQTRPDQTRERGANRTRGSRYVPDDFEATPEMIAFATDLGLDESTIATETAKFRDHEFKTPKKDWQKTWRNWIRRTAEYRQQKNQTETFDTTPTLAAKLQLTQRPGENAARFAKRVCDVDTLRRYGKG